jgi:tetratricopeptide (TPR) repeat protein
MPDAQWLKPRAPDIDNIRAALDWALEQVARALLGIALFGASARLWYMLDLVPEGQRYADKFVALIDDETPPAIAARALRYAGSLWREADRLRAVALLERSAALYRQIGDRPNLGTVQGLLGGNYYFLGRYDEAKAALDEARSILSGGNRLKSQINAMADLGNLAKDMNETDEARQYLVTALDLARKMKDVLRENNALLNLGDVEFRRGATDQAIECARDATKGFRAAGLNTFLARALTNLGEYQVLTDDRVGARNSAAEALSLLAGIGGHWLRLDLQTCALIAAQETRYSEAAQLQGFVEAGYVRTGESREPTEQKVYEAVMAILALHLTPEAIQALAAQGATWTDAGAVDFTLRQIIAPENPAA